MVNFGLLVAEILSLVWGTPANFNGFRVLAALLYGIVVGAKCANIVTSEGRELLWVNSIRYLGTYIESASSFILRRYSPTKLCDGAQMAIFGDFFASCICSEPRAAGFRPAF